MKILYVTTVSGTLNAFLVPHIKMLVELGHTVDIACNITNPIDNKLVEYGCCIYELNFSRFPISLRNNGAYKDLKIIIATGKYDIVHTHTPVASAITRLACKNISKTKVFYTAHGFHFYKGAPFRNWLFYYPLEKWLAKYTDTLITINKEDYYLAKSKFKAKRVEYIAGVGLDIDKIKNVVIDKVNMRKKLGIPQNAFVILSVGELNKNKNHEIVIRAIAKLNNPNVHYIICGKGPLEGFLKNIAVELGIGNNVHLLGFRTDIVEMCKISDIFVFPSLREGLPVSIMEAMASGMIILGSAIRGNLDLIIENKGGYIFNPKDEDELFRKLINILEKYSVIEPHFKKFNEERILVFAENVIIDQLRKIYDL